MSLEAWLAFCVTETVLCFTPGPAVLYVVSVALGRGSRTALAGAFGVLAANTFYFALSAVGIGALVATSHEVFLVLKWSGAAYLVWMGLGMLLGRHGDGASAEPDARGRAFRRGLIVQGANPKNLVFFTALLPQFVDAAAPVAPQVLIMGASSALIELGALGIYAAGAGRLRRAAGPAVEGPLRRVGGACLVGAGARLAWARPD